MKTDVYTDPISFALFTDDGTAEYYTVSVTPTTSWARYSVTVPGSSTATINNDNGAGLFLQFVLAGNTSSAIAAASDSTAYSTTRADFRTNLGNLLSSTSNAIYITGVQLEVGSKSTPFEHRSYGDELAKCQRYAFVARQDTAQQGFMNGAMWTNSVFIGVVHYPVTMRAKPDVTIAALGDLTIFANSGTDTIVSFQEQNAGLTATEISMDLSSGHTGGESAWARLASGGSGSRIVFNAEL
jgi:hypothetical protein